jgi:uncharacterized repeat protein (TIGR01451 family)
MRTNRGRILLAVIAGIVLALVAHTAANISVVPLATGNPALTTADLVDTLVGPGITDISNITFRGSSRAAGVFTGFHTTIGFDSGIVLSTGEIATNVVGPAGSKPGGSTSLFPFPSNSGDADLTVLARQSSQDPQTNTFDATVLEFDFVPDKNRVFFQYVFSSAEYNQFVGTQYNDVFAFFVTNGTTPGSQRVNCATLGGAPVSINTINAGPLVDPVPPSQFFTLDATRSRNAGLFINNDPLTGGGAQLNTPMDGQTRILTCQVPVTAGQVNHVKLAITDVFDAFYDSNVLLRGGSFTTTPPITIVKKTNRTDNDLAPGPYIEVGAPVAWTYEVKNNGYDALTSVSVADSQGVDVACPLTTLAPGQDMTCIGTGTAVAGQYANVGTATGFSSIAGLVSDSNPDHYFGAQPGIAIVKNTNETDNAAAPGPTILTGAPVVWTYEVTNTGNVPLENLAVNDSDASAVVDCSLLPGGPPKTILEVNQTMVCVARSIAIAGAYENTATATGGVRVLAPNGSVTTITRTASDDDRYFGANPEVTIVKKTGTDGTNATDNNAAPGPVILVGDPVAWTFVVTNTGNVALTDLTVTDNTIGAVCTIGSLALGEKGSCIATGTAQRDQHQNIGTASVTYGPVSVDGTARTTTVTRSAGDVDHYFGAAPEIALVKTTGTDSTNGTDNNMAPGPVILAGDPVVWTYTVTNTGNVPLVGVAVADVPLGAICTIDSLAAGESRPCAMTGTAQRDQHTNTGTATGHANVLTVNGPREVTRSASDVDFYFGAAPEVRVVKTTGTNSANSTDNNVAPGPVILVGDPVLWTYVVTNTGNVALTELAVTDDPLGAICTFESLAVGESHPCTKTGTAERGQHQNVSTTRGRADVLTVNGPRSVIRTATDLDHYFGADPKIAIVKQTNGTDNNVAPGPFILAKNLVTRTHHDKDNDRKHDDDKKEYNNHEDSKNEDRKNEDRKNEDRKADDHRKDDEDKKDDKKDDGRNEKDDHEKDGHATEYRKGRVKWTYVVTNTGNVPLTGVTVVDDKAGAVCTIGSLAAGATTTCTKSAAPVRGQYENTGTTSGNADVLTVDGRRLLNVTASDVDHYFGVDPDITIVKTTNGTNNNQAPGSSILVGTPVTWTYVVINMGNAPLADIAVVDDKVGPICTIALLDAGASRSCAATAVAAKGSYKNVGTAVATVHALTASGAITAVRVTAEDVDRYFGAHPAISIVKKTNGTNNDSAPGPFIQVGKTVTWTYAIRNTGNVPLTNLIVSDSKGVAISCSEGHSPANVARLAPGASLLCSAKGKAVEGQYENIGTVTAIAPIGPPLSASDADHYFGVERTYPPPPQACRVYAVNDQGLNDSQFYAVDLLTRIVTPVGPLYADHDIEAFDDHPTTGRLYAAAGLDNRLGQDGYLFELNALTGALTPIGYTGFSEIIALAFRPDGTLYAWSENRGLLQVNISTGQATLILDDGLNVEGMAWNNRGTLLYLGNGSKLFTYDPVSGEIDEVASNLPSPTEGLEFRPDGLLAVGVHGSSAIYAYDVNTKKVVAGQELSTGPYEDAEGIAWTCPTTGGRDGP